MKHLAPCLKGALSTLLLSNIQASPIRRGQESPVSIANGRKLKKTEYPLYIKQSKKEDEDANEIDVDSTNVEGLIEFEEDTKRLKEADDGPKQKEIRDDAENKEAEPKLRIDESSLHSLSTTYAGGWVQDGIMFDVRLNSTNEGITILGFDILTPTAYQTLCVEIYSKPGSYEGYDTTPSAWDFLGSVSVVGLGKDTPTIVPIGSFDAVTIGGEDGEQRSFYITTQEESLRYTAYPNGEHVSGSVFSSSSEGGVDVDVLVGVAKNYPFGQSWPDRMFNGAIRYVVGTEVDLSGVLNEEQLIQAELVKRGKFTCDVEPVAEETVVEESLTFSTSSFLNTSSLVTGAPTLAPVVVGSPTTSPSSSPNVAPTTLTPSLSPTNLSFTMKKLATTLHGGLKQSGVMFDIRVPSVQEGGPPEGVTILTFEVSTFLTEEICVEVYTKSGTHVGFEDNFIQEGNNDQSAWSNLGAATTLGMGEEQPTHLPVGSFDHTFIEAGETRAFYVTMNIPEMRYTEPAYNEVTGDVFVESSMTHLQILVGTALAYPFGQSWGDRIYNGAVLFALGEVSDGTYSDVTSRDRARSCPRASDAPTGAPTDSPTRVETKAPVVPETDSGVALVDVETTVAAVDTTTMVTTAAPVDSEPPAEEGGLDFEEMDEEAKEESYAKPTTSNTATSSSTGGEFSPSDFTPNHARLEGTCPSASPLAMSTSQEVVINYQYPIITKLSEDADEIVTDIENAMQKDLIEGKCSSRAQFRRFLQESIDYYGFNSNPPDEITDMECAGVSLSSDEKCQVVQGGFTAFVPQGVEESVIQNDLEPFSSDVLKENGVVLESDNESSTVEIEEETSNADVMTLAAVEDQGQDGGDEPKSLLSTTAIIIIAAVAGCVVLALVLVFMKGRNRKRVKRSHGNEELFHEFDEDPSVPPDYVTENRSQSTAKSVDKPLFPRHVPDEESTIGKNAPMILNEHDEMSLISNDLSKSRFAVPPTTPGSDVSNTSSRGSVKFVRAGESFTSRSHQPEDTVDL